MYYSLKNNFYSVKKISFAVIASLLFVLASCNGVKVYHASDFGIVPGTGEDMTEEIAKAIETIKTERVGKPAVLLFEGG